MTERSGWVPADVDLSRPSVSRMYDYYLGGSHNFEIDRVAARAAVDAAPNIIAAARANRSFLARVVRFAIGVGIRQFLDLGSGIPTVGNVHEIAHTAHPSTRTVYVDHDPIAVMHARTLLTGDPRVAVLGEDITRLPQILDQVTTGRLLNLNEPVAVLLVSVAHFIPGDIAALLAPLRQALAPGSILTISHATHDPARDDPQRLLQVRKAYEATPSGLHPRTSREIQSMFTGFTLVSPVPDSASRAAGRLVSVNAWRPDPDDPQPPIPGFVAGVGIRQTSSAGTCAAVTEVSDAMAATTRPPHGAHEPDYAPWLEREIRTATRSGLCGPRRPFSGGDL